MRIETLAVHAGRHCDPATGAVAAPIYLSSTYERDPGGDYSRGFSYSREDNPNRRSLEQCLAAIEAGTRALAFSSGLSVVAAVVQGLEPGDHILLSGDVYYGVRKVIHDVFGKWPLETTYADFSDLDAFQAALRPNTRLIWFETPSNPLLKILDLSAIGAIARKTSAITVCDSTFATPILQRPLDHSIDMVMHSTTKYIGGHSDSLGGALITRFDNYLFERARKFQHHGGAVPSPFESWLTLRGIETLPWRVRAQSEHALAVAEFLAAHPKVEHVHYPGLAAHPGHALASRQMSGFGGMLSFQVPGGRKEAMDVVARARLFIRATSLGGTHSLIEHRASIEGRGTATPQNLIRTSIGLEHPSDLIDDLAYALDAVP
jgi:cystathionine gamma-synthase